MLFTLWCVLCVCVCETEKEGAVGKERTHTRTGSGTPGRRPSQLTTFLVSLCPGLTGGNGHAVMIPHRSSADTAFEESQNTLTCVSWAKDIKTRVGPLGLSLCADFLGSRF